jgi:hypothetical protein
MKAGRDVDGIWTVLESGLRYVPIRVQSVCHNLSQDLCRLVAHSMDCPPSPRNREKEIRHGPFPTVLQRTDPSAAADGRKQEGFILLFGKRPH